MRAWAGFSVGQTKAFCARSVARKLLKTCESPLKGKISYVLCMASCAH